METNEKPKNDKRGQKLVLGLLFDLIGMSSVAFPLLDFVWAPLSAFLMTKMYRGNVGKVAGIISFIEEALPITDVIPTFTLTWIYTYVIKKGKIN